MKKPISQTVTIDSIKMNKLQKAYSSCLLCHFKKYIDNDNRSKLPAIKFHWVRKKSKQD